MSFRLKVKNGDSKYQWDKEQGSYEFTDADLVDDYETLTEALRNFLEWVGDEELDSKVTLSFTPKTVQKRKKGKKGQKG